MQQNGKAIVGLDSSGSTLTVAVSCLGKICTRRRTGIKQERLLFPALKSALAACNAQMTDIGGVFIVRGPGRFTGIRISLTFASMLKYLNHAQVRGATLFEVLRKQTEDSSAFKKWQKENPSGVLGVVLHAFREEYFLQFFDDTKSAPLWLSREELLKRLETYARPLFLAGSAKDEKPLETLLGPAFAYAAKRDCFVRPATLLAMAQEDRWTENALEPLYLKPARFELVTPK